MKKYLILLLLGFCGTTQASVIYDFYSHGSFGYGGLTWTTGTTNVWDDYGYVETTDTGAPFYTVDSVSIYGGDDGTAFDSATYIESSTAQAGTLSFDWSYSTPLFFDAFQWAVGTGAGAVQDLAFLDGEFGSFSVNLLAGDIFSLAIYSANIFGQSYVEITNLVFSADGKPGEGSVPAPAVFWLLATGLVALGFVRRRKSFAMA